MAGGPDALRDRAFDPAAVEVTVGLAVWELFNEAQRNVLTRVNRTNRDRG